MRNRALVVVLSLVDEGGARQLAPPLQPPATDQLRVRGGGPPRPSQPTPVQLHRHSRTLGSGGGQLAEPTPLRLGHPLGRSLVGGARFGRPLGRLHRRPSGSIGSIRIIRHPLGRARRPRALPTPPLARQLALVTCRASAPDPASARRATLCPTCAPTPDAATRLALVTCRASAPDPASAAALPSVYVRSRRFYGRELL